MIWRTLFLLLAAFAAGCFVASVGNHRRAIEQQVALQNSLLAYNAQTIAAQKAEADRVIAVIAARSPEREAQARAIEAIIKEVQNAPSTEACVSSPAIVLALDQLRGLPGPGGQQPRPAP